MANPELHLGVCGEHGGDPASIHFFDQAGLDYVSCSPFRVPVARLEAGRARTTPVARTSTRAMDSVEATGSHLVSGDSCRLPPRTREADMTHSTLEHPEGGDPMGRRPHRHRLADGRAGHPRGRHRAQHHPPRLRRLGRTARVDGELLQPHLRRTADHRGRGRRPVRTAQAVRRRAGPLHGLLGGLRAGPGHRVADRRSGRPGRRGGAGHHRWVSRCSARRSRPRSGAPRSGSSARSPDSRSPADRWSVAPWSRGSAGSGSSG